MKLLIVDDSLCVRRKIERSALGRKGLSILTADNGQQAVELFEHERPELVTMDLTMPKMGGVECVKRLTEINSDVHILVISALSDKLTALSAIKNGAEGFLKKPFSDDELHCALDELVGKYVDAS